MLGGSKNAPKMAKNRHFTLKNLDKTRVGAFFGVFLGFFGPSEQKNMVRLNGFSPKWRFLTQNSESLAQKITVMPVFCRELTCSRNAQNAIFPVFVKNCPNWGGVGGGPKMRKFHRGGLGGDFRGFPKMRSRGPQCAVSRRA